MRETEKMHLITTLGEEQQHATSAEKEDSTQNTHTHTNKRIHYTNVQYEKSLISRYGLVDNYLIRRSGGLAKN
jgi:hypothetical protein